MKKTFLYLGMAAFLAMFAYACGSDSSDGDDTPPSSIPAAPYADKAVKFTIPGGVKATEASTDEEVSLTAINMTEGAKGIIETKKGDVKKYLTCDVLYESDTEYIIKQNNKEVGRIEKVESSTKAQSEVSLKIKLDVMIPVFGRLVFETEDAVSAVQAVKTIASSTAVTSLARNWTVQNMKLTLVFDNKNKADASTIVYGGNLTKFIDLADKNNVSLSDDDRARLSKEIKGINIDQNALFAIEYTDGTSDVADWRWNGSGEKSIKLTLKDDDMGNKFLNNNSGIEVQFPGNGICTLILSTRLEKDGCNASLLINLK